jgi:hypothetical protein
MRTIGHATYMLTSCDVPATFSGLPLGSRGEPAPAIGSRGGNWWSGQPAIMRRGRGGHPCIARTWNAMHGKVRKWCNEWIGRRTNAPLPPPCFICLLPHFFPSLHWCVSVWCTSCFESVPTPRSLAIPRPGIGILSHAALLPAACFPVWPSRAPSFFY